MLPHYYYTLVLNSVQWYRVLLLCLKYWLQVSHHPPASALHVEHKDWTFWQEFTLTSKFRGKYLQVIPHGTAHLKFTKTGYHYTWKKVTTTVHNIIVGKLWIDQVRPETFIKVYVSAANILISNSFVDWHEVIIRGPCALGIIIVSSFSKLLQLWSHVLCINLLHLHFL